MADAAPALDTPALEIDDLYVSVDGHEILRGVSLAVEPGRLHALMGPNGSGKSTLANTLLANPVYEVTAGRILLNGEDITALPTDERAARGMFLGFQHPEEIPGVSVLNFLRQAISRRKGIDDFSVLEVRMQLIAWTKRLGMDTRFQERYLNEGFSGGEKKRNEVLQMALMEPDVAVLDETDSGLDIDALRHVAAASTEVRADRPHLGILTITHYQRILEYLVPDVVHVLVDGRIVANGDARTRQRGRGARLRRVSGRSCVVTALDVAAVKRDFPHSRARGERQAARLSRLGRRRRRSPFTVLDAMDGMLPPLLRQHPPRRVPDRRRGHRRVRGGAPKVARFVHAPRTNEIIFVRNATEAINLVAYTWARANLHAGDAIVLTHMEHHANVVPWQMLAAERGIELRWIPLTADYTLDLTHLDELLDGAKLFAVSAMSNVLGTINDIRPLADAAHAHGALVLVDACQYVPARRHRRASVGRRLRRLLRAQDVRSQRDRRAVGTRGAARRDAAVPRRRRDDPRRAPRRLHSPTSCRGSSRPARPRSSRPSASAPRSTT